MHSRAPAPGGDRDRPRARQGRSGGTPAAAVLRLQGRAGNQVVARLLDPVRRGPRPFFDEDELWAGPEPKQDPLEAKIEAEWETLRPIHRFFAEATLDFYKQVRRALLNTFGAQQDGDELALQRVLAYYRSLVRVSFQGFQLWVHPDMAARLAIAEQRLGASFPLQSAYGANIRFNTNNPSVLSDHSFGSAIDINGSTSPNVKDLGPGSQRARMIEAITGVDPSQDAAGHTITTDARDHEAMLREARRLQLGSDRLKAAFADEESLVRAALEIASRRGEPAGDAEELSPLLFAAGEERGRWRYRPVAPAGATEGRDRHRQALARFLFPTELGDQSRDWPPELVQATVDLLALMARTFRATFTARGRVAATARSPSDAQLAFHGFLSVPPEVVAALSGSDAGDLRWLGAMRGGTKDYMHFELRERPKLY